MHLIEDKSSFSPSCLFPALQHPIPDATGHPGMDIVKGWQYWEYVVQIIHFIEFFASKNWGLAEVSVGVVSSLSIRDSILCVAIS